MQKTIINSFFNNGHKILGFLMSLSILFSSFYMNGCAVNYGRRLADQQPVSNLSNKLGMQFVYVKPGTFQMGSDLLEQNRNGDERLHSVTLQSGYYLQITEVTQGQWESVMKSNPSFFNSSNMNHPVENVSWDDVQVFIRKLSKMERSFKYRLPTETEWEYACKAGSNSRFSFGNNDKQLVSYAWYTLNSNDKTHTVGQKQANGWGLYDMHGNVREWCQDWYGEYSQTKSNNGPSGGWNRVIRGGDWSLPADECRSAYRQWDKPNFRDSGLGFRLVLVVD